MARNSNDEHKLHFSLADTKFKEVQKSYQRFQIPKASISKMNCFLINPYKLFFIKAVAKLSDFTAERVKVFRAIRNVL